MIHTKMSGHRCIQSHSICADPTCIPWVPCASDDRCPDIYICSITNALGPLFGTFTNPSKMWAKPFAPVPINGRQVGSESTNRKIELKPHNSLFFCPLLNPLNHKEKGRPSLPKYGILWNVSNRGMNTQRLPLCLVCVSSILLNKLCSLLYRSICSL